MEFTDSEFAEYVNEKYGFVIDYLISKNTAWDKNIISFMTNYAKKCAVADFTDTTVVKSLFNADYCPKYDKRKESALRDNSLNEILDKKQVKEVFVAEFITFIDEQNRENESVAHDINKLTMTVSDYKRREKDIKKDLCGAVQDYIRQVVFVKPPPAGDTILKDLLDKYPYADIESLKTITITDFIKKFINSKKTKATADILKKIENYKISFICTYNPPNKYNYDYDPKGLQLNKNYIKCIKESKDFAKPGEISDFFIFERLYKFCKLFYSLTIIDSAQSYMVQMPVFDNSSWFVNHGLKSICILFCNTNINYIIDFFTKVEQSVVQPVVQIVEQKGEDPGGNVCQFILQQMPIDITNITKLYHNNIEEFYTELNHFIKLYLNAYEFMKPYEFVYEIKNRISYVMSILLNYLIRNIKEIIYTVNLYIAELQKQLLQQQQRQQQLQPQSPPQPLIDNIRQYIKLLGYEHDSTKPHYNLLSFHLTIVKYNRSYRRITVLGSNFSDCVETGFLALLVYLLSDKDNNIDASRVVYKPIKEFLETYNTSKKINENRIGNEEWALALSGIKQLHRVDVLAIDSTTYNIIVLFLITFYSSLPDGSFILSKPEQIDMLSKPEQIIMLSKQEQIDMLIQLIKTTINDKMYFDIKKTDYGYEIIINNYFLLGVTPTHTYYSYVKKLPVLPDIIFNIYIFMDDYYYSVNLFGLEQTFKKYNSIFVDVVEIARILQHDPRNNSIIKNYIDKPHSNPLYIYLTTKANYDISELFTILEFNKLNNYVFKPEIGKKPEVSKKLLLQCFAVKDSIGILKDTILYLLDCLFPKETIEYDDIIEILVPYLKIHGTHNKIQVIELIRKKCVMFSKIQYDFFTPYLIDNTNVNFEVLILKLIFTEYVYYTYWKSPEESPIHIYLKNNADKLYEYKSEVILTLHYYLHPSCITVLNKNIYDSQISNLLTQISKLDDKRKQKQTAAPPAEILAGGRKYRTKSMKKYKFSYQ